MSKKISLFVFLFCILPLTSMLVPGPVCAGSKTKAAGPDGAGAVMFILDASGSMWGQVNGKAKIAIAKEVMRKLVDGLPQGMQVGLTAYGHRRKGDCGDIEILIKPGTLDRNAFKTKVEAINPKGKTPIMESVLQAAKAMRYTESRATVVLVSDGLETCAANPCALAAKLAKAGVDFTVHVIGFAISKDEQERLRCLADATGGMFISANDAKSLLSALNTTMAKVKQAPKAVVATPGKATLQAPARVPVGKAFLVKWQGPDSKGDYVALARKGDKDSVEITYAYTKTGNPVRLTAPGEKGDYELRYVHGHTSKVIGRAAITLTPVTASVQTLATAQAAQKIQVKWQGPGYTGDYICISRPDQEPGSYQQYAYVSAGNPLTLQAPAEPGSYEVRYILSAGDKLIAKAPIQITPAKAAVKAPAQARAAQKIKVSWIGPDNDGDYISIAKPDQDSGSYEKYTYTSEGNPLTLQAPAQAGRFEIRYIQGLGDKLLAKTNIEITAVSATVKAPVSANAGSKIKVSWTGPAYEGDYVSIAKPDQDSGSYEKYAYVRVGNPLTLQAPAQAGRFEIRYIQGQGDKLLAKTEIEIKAVSATVKAPATANAGSKVKVSWTGPAYEGDYVSIAKPDQDSGSYEKYTYTSEGNPLTLQAPAHAGRFEIRYIQGLGNKLLAKAQIEIKAVSATVKAPVSANAGSKVKVSWTGPAYEGDYISIAKPDQDSGSYEKYTYTSEGNPLTLQAPGRPGRFEIRYVQGLGDKLLAKAEIEIKAVNATVKAPEEVKADAAFKVSWKGPGNENDYICIARPDQDSASYEYNASVKAGNPLSLQAPPEPGVYEIRYILGEGDVLLVKQVIKVK